MSATKFPPSRRQPAAASASRVGLVAALALALGAGGGYLLRAPFESVETTVSAPNTTRQFEVVPAVSITLPPVANEQEIHLRLDRGLESVSRVRTQASAKKT